jgi:pilus assembly protein CpaB
MKTAMSIVRRAWAAVSAQRTAWMALGALAFGAMAVFGARNYIGERLALEKARLQPRHEMVELVVAKRDLRRGDTVGPDTMAVRALPREYAPGGAVAPDRFEAVAGARLLVAMKAGEPLLPAAVATPETAGISSRVKPGIRAMTIAVDEVNSLSGMLQPGDRIDLMLSVRPPSVSGIAQPEITRTLMQGVPVMATGRQSRAAFGDEAAAGRSYTSITVEVDPGQAQKLVVAQRSGKLTAVLRNPDDHRTVGDRRLDVNMLLGLPVQPAALPVRAAPEVIVGGRGSLPPEAGAGGAPAGAATAGGPDVQAGAGPGAVQRASPGISPGISPGPAQGPAPGTGHAMGTGLAPRMSEGALRPPPAGLPTVPMWGVGALAGQGPAGVPGHSGSPQAAGVWVPVEPPATIPLYR